MSDSTPEHTNMPRTSIGKEHALQHANNFPLYIVHDTMYEIEDGKNWSLVIIFN